MEKFTWKQLAEAIDKLPAKEKEKQVYISIEDEGKFTKVESLETIPHDVYVNIHNDEDAGDLDTLMEAYGADFDKKDFKLATKAGTPFLWDGF